MFTVLSNDLKWTKLFSADSSKGHGGNLFSRPCLLPYTVKMCHKLQQDRSSNFKRHWRLRGWNVPPVGTNCLAENLLSRGCKLLSNPC